MNKTLAAAGIALMSTGATASDTTPLVDAARQGFMNGVSVPFQAAGLISPPEWITIKPRSTTDCLAESNQVIDAAYVRCKNGYQQQIEHTVDGHEHVITERAIPR